MEWEVRGGGVKDGRRGRVVGVGTRTFGAWAV